MDLSSAESGFVENSMELCQLRWDKHLSRMRSASVDNIMTKRIGIVCSDVLGLALSDGLFQAGFHNQKIAGPDSLFDAHPELDSQSKSLLKRLPTSFDRMGVRDFEIRSLEDLFNESEFVAVALSGVLAQDKIVSEINQYLFSNKKKSILIRTSGSEITVGPLCFPESGTCCYAEVLNTGPFSPPIQGSQSLKFMEPVGPVPYFLAAGNFVAAVVSDALLYERLEEFSNRIWVSGWSIWKFKSYRILKSPRCSVCGRLDSFIPEGRHLDE